MDEFTFIDSITQHSYKQKSLLKGIGDDAAVFRQPVKDIVTAVDTFVDGIHFTKDTMESFHIGYRALAANLSDIAAMGASPAFYLVSIVIPKDWSETGLKQIFSGMKVMADRYHVDLIGGDTVSGAELSIAITVIGYVEKGKARYRDAARADDIVFVTGTLGDARAGLHVLTHREDYHDADYYIERHRMPSPRLNFAGCLAELKRVALNDISDGIANEAAEIAVASQVNMVIYDHLVPVSASYHQFPEQLKHEWKYFGGEDFELLGTVHQDDWQAVKDIAVQTNTRLTKIGYVSSDKNNGQVFLNKDNVLRKLKKWGYSHLK
ncbi:thiamine-monophosphate kinase [Virgibacillus halotolerans]|uniref:thiamine-phosphate kinase n=1 Tax=Virgibacillus halotolerans TaxID=1071053 RepID=UPI001961F688|nr:thiamine-phosphate kinase [Virgibacillus halotolerans]MBM7601570.1 thiamine-monophosphate kinase [Virgibacillus halotolerans]